MKRKELQMELIRVREAMDMITVALDNNYDQELVKQLQEFIEEHNRLVEQLKNIH